MPKRQKKVSRLLRDFYSTGIKGIAWLVDPDKIADIDRLKLDFSWINKSNLDLILVGGSQLDRDNFDAVVGQHLTALSGQVYILKKIITAL